MVLELTDDVAIHVGELGGGGGRRGQECEGGEYLVLPEKLLSRFDPNRQDYNDQIVRVRRSDGASDSYGRRVDMETGNHVETEDEKLKKEKPK